MTQFDDEILLKVLKTNDTEMYTLAEIHKIILQNDIKCSIEEIRKKIHILLCDGYLGFELISDGIKMYFVIFSPEY
ncbi:hypothetical protein [Clostridium saccharobutylicum]|uniref:Uncharacterized protein n=1 Tax=Clostridium saccharobutylicum DSM 13864 TaxID=1345695 RepID=U5MRA9_CLOSA|nr:hypothetical protein [Clostridium saccharobutylicum]AGX43038.1 hypothetical protein CLSA_c20550 [Clostridium saccharobutylicum DSM 13864]AQR90329.1 hypothetical protein CLOSC_20440 [Clostridium saccharobutylicum]AQS00235.1 hypothetical protein CSACC_20510 [Clostridium saccharobutylicum]AQS10034.1 hypothetical protein CLOBY_21730 [Clostridium saccharobutylicum]AQS14218.1 hypothetical protein CLOSACC_20510 [Clostridium saccharobutylicum]